MRRGPAHAGRVGGHYLDRFVSLSSASMRRWQADRVEAGARRVLREGPSEHVAIRQEQDTPRLAPQPIPSLIVLLFNKRTC